MRVIWKSTSHKMIGRDLISAVADAVRRDDRRAYGVVFELEGKRRPGQ